jgi:hypothetical protein
VDANNEAVAAAVLEAARFISTPPEGVESRTVRAFCSDKGRKVRIVMSELDAVTSHLRVVSVLAYGPDLTLPPLVESFKSGEDLELVRRAAAIFAPPEETAG